MSGMRLQRLIKQIALEIKDLHAVMLIGKGAYQSLLPVKGDGLDGTFLQIRRNIYRNCTRRVVPAVKLTEDLEDCGEDGFNAAQAARANTPTAIANIFLMDFIIL
jgi:hypothetical protein